MQTLAMTKTVVVVAAQQHRASSSPLSSSGSSNTISAAAGSRRRFHRRSSSRAAAQQSPLTTTTQTFIASDVLKASAVHAPAGAVVPSFAENEAQVPKVVAVAGADADATAVASAADVKNADVDQQPPHAPLRSPPSPLINYLPRSRWPRGIPVVMGAHLLASGSVAPISVSKGPGIDVTPHQFQYQVSGEDEQEGEGGESAAEVSATIHGSPASLAAALAAALADAASAAVASRGHFALAVSGGSVLELLAKGLKDNKKGVDFSKWTVTLADERLVSADAADSNLRAARAALPALFNSAVVVAPFTDVAGGTAGAAKEFEGALRRLPPSVLPRIERKGGDDRSKINLPSFDAAVLGLGDDGHVASLFPNHPSTAVDDGSWVVAVEEAPKKPPRRVSLSLPALRAAKNVFIAASGEAKASAVQRALEVQALPGAVPAQMVRPLPSSSSRGRVRWMIDADAGSLLRPEAWEDAKAWPRSAI